MSKRKADDSPNAADEPGNDAAPVSGSGRKSLADRKKVSPAASPKKKAAPKPAPNVTYYDAATMRKPAPDGPYFKLVSFNVAGLRAVLKKDKDAFKKLVAAENPDVICLQEIKVSEEHLAKLEQEMQLPGWSFVWNVSTAKKGYSGVATLVRGGPPLSTKMGIGHAFDGEGRVLTTEHAEFYVINAYVPNSGDKLVRLPDRLKSWDPTFSAFAKGLEATKPVIIVGDLNCAREDIDIHSPKTNLKTAGFTPEERASFQQLLMEEGGFVDTFRAQHPDVVGYTYFSHRFQARQNNKGWRLDYFLASKSLAPRCYDAWQSDRTKDYQAGATALSDHIPIGLTVTLAPA